MSTQYPIQGGCDCKAIRYQITKSPLIVHCCHCRWCQRETGASFALNAMIESSYLELLKGQPELINTPSASGKGQKILRCPHCKIAVWSHYSGGGEKLSFVRVGTLDSPDLLPPDIHIFTSTKQPWVRLQPETPAVTEYYEREKIWPKESQERLKILFGK